MFVLYDEKTRDIVGTIAGPDQSYGAQLSAAGESWIFVSDGTPVDVHNQYVSEDPPELRALQASEISVVRGEPTRVENIPIGASVQIFCSGSIVAAFEASEAWLEIESDVASKYLIVIKAPMFLQFTAEVEARP